MLIGKSQLSLPHSNIYVLYKNVFPNKWSEIWYSRYCIYIFKMWHFTYVNIALRAQKIIEYDLNLLLVRMLLEINEIVQAEHEFQIPCNKNKLRYN